jgi:hypothetical protein
VNDIVRQIRNIMLRDRPRDSSATLPEAMLAAVAIPLSHPLLKRAASSSYFADVI